MTHNYCLDTSGFSGPLMEIPEDIHKTFWSIVVSKINAGMFCWNVEIANEMDSIEGAVGSALKSCKGTCCLEVGEGSWAWKDYLTTLDSWRDEYCQYISEYNSNRKNTIGLNDLSIVALAHTLHLPVVSMEKPNLVQFSQTKLRIPDLCKAVRMNHFNFTEICRRENIKA